PDGVRSELTCQLVAPRSALEEELCAMFRDVLHVDQLGIHDNFFALGGHSLRAAQLIARIRQRFHTDILLRNLLVKPTVAGLATLLEPARAEGMDDERRISEIG